MEIRPLTPEDDCAAVSRVYEESWKSAYRGIIPQEYLDGIQAESWSGAIDAPGRRSLIMLDSGKIAGTSCYCPSRLEQMKDWGEIVSIYLLPEYCGNGYGAALMRRAIEELENMGFCKIFLWVLEKNFPARGFYEKFGFKCSGKYHDDCIGGKVLREVQYIYHVEKKTD